jgi:hypothetical protein
LKKYILDRKGQVDSISNYILNTMERLSNNYQDLIKQVRQEFNIVELEGGENLLAKYSEIPWFPGGQFCISIISNAEGNGAKLVKKVWDSDYDLNRFSVGIYNLDRLCIKKEEINLATAQYNELEILLNSITQLPHTLNDESYTVLDGIEYDLTVNTKQERHQYQWRVPKSEIMHFNSLINFLLTVTSDK